MGKQTLTKAQVKTMLKSLGSVNKSIGKVSTRSKKLRVTLPDVSSIFGKSFMQGMDKLQKYVGKPGSESKVTKYKTMLMSKVTKKISSLKDKYAKLVAKEKKEKDAAAKKKAKDAAKKKAAAAKKKAKEVAKAKAAKAKADKAKAAKPKKSAAKPKKSAAKPKKSAAKPKKSATAKPRKSKKNESVVPSAFHYNLFGGNDMLRAFEDSDDASSDYEFE